MSVGLSIQDAQYANIGIGAIQFVMAIVSINLMDRLGRRTLLLSGMTIMFLSNIVFTIAFNQSVSSVALCVL